MAHDRVHLHARHRDDRLALGVKRRELALGRCPLQHEIVPAVGRVAAVAELAAERGPKDWDERFGGGRRGRGDAVRDAPARVLRDVPVLDSRGGAVAAGAVVGVCGYVADGVDVWLRQDAEGLIGAEGPVLFEGYIRVGF